MARTKKAQNRSIRLDLDVDEHAQRLTDQREFSDWISRKLREEFGDGIAQKMQRLDEINREKMLLMKEAEHLEIELQNLKPTIDLQAQIKSLKDELINLNSEKELLGQQRFSVSHRRHEYGSPYHVIGEQLDEIRRAMTAKFTALESQIGFTEFSKWRAEIGF